MFNQTFRKQICKSYTDIIYKYQMQKNINEY